MEYGLYLTLIWIEQQKKDGKWIYELPLVIRGYALNQAKLQNNRQGKWIFELPLVVLGLRINQVKTQDNHLC